MKPSRVLGLIILTCGLLMGAVVTAQVYLSPVQLADVQANGSNLGYFHKVPSVTKWDVKGTGNARVSGRTLLIGEHYAPFNPDAGAIPIGTLAARPTCAVGIRGYFYTQWTAGTGDAGVKDITSQCCKAADGTYSWVATVCQ